MGPAPAHRHGIAQSQGIRTHHPGRGKIRDLRRVPHCTQGAAQVPAGGKAHRRHHMGVDLHRLRVFPDIAHCQGRLPQRDREGQRRAGIVQDKSRPASGRKAQGYRLCLPGGGPGIGPTGKDQHRRTAAADADLGGGLRVPAGQFSQRPLRPLHGKVGVQIHLFITHRNFLLYVMYIVYIVYRFISSERQIGICRASAEAPWLPPGGSCRAQRD